MKPLFYEILLILHICCCSMSVEKFRRGDKTAFDELVRKYQKKIYELAYHFTRNVEDALDLSQEIFLRAFKSLGTFKQKSSF